MKHLTLSILFFGLISISIAQDLPRVIILGTGGTIAGEGKSADRAGYTSGKIPVEDLIGGIPSVKQYAQISGEQISSVGSQDMSVDIWMKLDKRINEIFANKEADGVVITHGTDTQEETAYFLTLTTRYKNPVVLTGSMRPATAISADGPKNLFDAIVVAANKKSVGRGVMVVFDENIFSGRDISKSSTTKLAGFNAPNSGPIGQIYDGKVIYYTSTDRTKESTPFDIKGLIKLPEVVIVPMYADASADMLDFYINKKVDGIIISGVGNGNVNKALMDGIKRATDAGIKVVRASRVPSGRVVLEDEFDDKAYGTIASDDLNPQKSRILLMLGLTKSKETAKLQEYFFQF